VRRAARAEAEGDSMKFLERFYDQFKSEREAFSDCIVGIDDANDRSRYASLMLRRLMFVNFLQSKRFLDDEADYLRNRLASWMRERNGASSSFYRHFLLRLFHEGLDGAARNEQLGELLGRIPYIAGGLFEKHPLERHYPCIAIPDAAFERIFACFDRYRWRLDERPSLGQDEITPDVLGYVFEKYVNQKQMGAYYTKPDVTEYIARNTVIPFLFDAAKTGCAAGFENPDGATIWELLRENPDRYIHAAVRHGVTWDIHSNTALDAPLEYPADIAAGIHDVSARCPWKRPASHEFALPTETWREVIARRTRHSELRAKLAAGEVRAINDFVTLNLDIRQFAADAIGHCETPDLLRAFWNAIRHISVLDPTCGSGAFLFAALEILEPLYAKCLERMRTFAADPAWRADSEDFNETLARAAAHPNPRYFILKSIILDNLFGVDIMEEAVEICRFRLLLKLAAQIVPDASRANLGIEPLPNIDFNIRAGNALVGHTAYVSTAQLETLDDDASNRFLARQYSVDDANETDYSEWLQSHKPFHWCSAFRRIVERGGFDVIIGNPPYVAASRTRKLYDVREFRTAAAPDIYAWVLERSSALLSKRGRTGMIVPLSLGFGADFADTRRLLYSDYAVNWFSSFSRIPSALFSHDVRVRNTIHIGAKGDGPSINLTTRLHRWFEAYRPQLMSMLSYGSFQPEIWSYRIPKIENERLIRAFESQILNRHSALDNAISKRTTPHVLHFKKSAYNWLNYCRELPPCFDRGGSRIEHTKFGQIAFDCDVDQKISLLIANGKLMLLFWFAIGDDFDVTRWNFTEFPLDPARLSVSLKSQLLAILPELESRMTEHIQFKLNAGKKVGNYNLARCRDITDRSDRIICSAIGFEDLWEEIELYYDQTVKTVFGDANKPDGFRIER
jgi:hypothetical protein